LPAHALFVKESRTSAGDYVSALKRAEERTRADDAASGAIVERTLELSCCSLVGWAVESNAGRGAGRRGCCVDLTVSPRAIPKK
jgi:hypothetical protein